MSAQTGAHLLKANVALLFMEAILAKTDPYLERRKSGFYWRRRCPTALSNQNKPQFFCFALKTHFLPEAAVLARRLTAISEACFRTVGRLQPEVISQILTGYARLEIEMADRLRAYTPLRSREAAETAMQIEAAARQALMDALFLCDRSPATEPIMATAQKLGLQIDAEDRDFPILADRMLRLMIEVSVEKERRSRGIFSDTQPWLQLALREMTQQSVQPNNSSLPPGAPAVTMPITTVSATQASAIMNEPSEPTIERAPVKAKKLKVGSMIYKAHVENEDRVGELDDTLSLLDLFDLFINARERGELSVGSYSYEVKSAGKNFSRNIDTIISTRKLLERHFGVTPAAQVTIAQMHEFSKLLLKLPSNQGKLTAHEGKSLLAIIKMTDDLDKIAERKVRIEQTRLGASESEIERKYESARQSRLSARTVQRHQQTVSSVLDFAVQKGKLLKNVMKDLVFTDQMLKSAAKGQEDNGRKLWNAEFAKLLATPHWQEPNKGIVDALYWAPIIAFLHGMRSEEILQLKPTDVKSENGLYFFDLRQGEDQALKSASARRSIPLHKGLLELGFLKLVAHQADAGEDRIFTDIRRARSGKQNFTTMFTKEFTRYRQSCGVYEKNRDFHALRTTFHSALVAQGVPDSVRKYLMGHVNEDVGIVHYLPEGFPLSRLKEFIDHIPFDPSPIKRRYNEAIKPARLKLVGNFA